MMEFNKYTTFVIFAMFILLVAPSIMARGLDKNEIDALHEKPDLRDLAPKQIDVTDRLDNSYEVRPDGTWFKGLRQNTPVVWIDGKQGNVYHVDSLRDFVENETVELRFFYDVQPDWIKHYTHSGKFDRSFFPTQWDWEASCSGEECNGGWVTIEVSNIEEGTGSSVFPIGVDGPQWATEGQDFGEFNGNNSVVVIPAFNFPATQDISFGGWFNFTENQGRFITRIYGSGLGSRSGSLDIDTNSKFVSVFVNTTGNIFSCFGTSTDNFNSWTQAMGVINITGQYQEVYVNGVMESQCAIMGDSDTSTGSTLIGQDGSGSPVFTNGSIDEVLIYNQSLTPAQITTIFNQYTVISTGVNRIGTPSTDGLVLSINFDNYSVADNSGSGNNGVATNVTFGVVFNVLRTLNNPADFTINAATGLFTIVNNNYEWAQIVASWLYVSGQDCPAGVNPEDIAEDFGEFITGLLGFLGIIGIVLGVIWLIMYVAKLFSKGGLNDLGATA